MIHRSSLDLMQGLFHVIETIDVTKEDGELSPCPNTRMSGCNGGAILALGRAVVFVFLGDLCIHPDGRWGIKSTNCLGLLLGFVFPAAHYARRREVELSQVFPGFPVSGIEFNGTLESGATLLAQSCGRKKSGAVRLLAINTTEPDIVKAVLRI